MKKSFILVVSHIKGPRAKGEWLANHPSFTTFLGDSLTGSEEPGQKVT